MDLIQLSKKVSELDTKIQMYSNLTSKIQELETLFDVRLKRNKINTKRVIDEYLNQKQRQIDLDTHKLKQLQGRVAQEIKFSEELRAKDLEALKNISEEKSKGFPWLAEAYADYYALREQMLADFLENKTHPALKASEIIKQNKQDKRELIIKYKVVQYLLNYYETLFPSISDYKDEEADDLLTYILENKNKEDSEDEENGFDPGIKYLSHLSEEEYKKLTSTEKSQLALDRYKKRTKRRWEIGREYERYIGYLYEKDGYHVNYFGITKGIADLGRDLICKKGIITEIVQCKCWTKKKLIHEKHINQLYGTTAMYYIENQYQNKYSTSFSDTLKEGILAPCFVTSTTLSEEAKSFANALGVNIKDNIPLSDYPCIKCNISRKTNEKIYHLPFDQQYDSTLVEEERNECYVDSIIEAEKNRFRRAFKWRPSLTLK